MEDVLFCHVQIVPHPRECFKVAWNVKVEIKGEFYVYTERRKRLVIVTYLKLYNKYKKIFAIFENSLEILFLIFS